MGQKQTRKQTEHEKAGKMVGVELTLYCLPVAHGFGQTINGDSMAYRSSGAASGTDWTLSENGYVGTYIKLDAPGDVTVSAGLGSGWWRRRPEYEYRDRRYYGGLRCDIRFQ